MIEYYESATHLNISFNKHIGTRGWQAASHMMRKTSSLTYLDARNTPLLDHSAPFVARALRISGSLAVLHLENAGLSGRPLMLLATALKMNMNLRELYLADNKLNGLQDSAQLGNLLKFNYNIQILDLRNNHILDTGLAYVCEGLKEQRKGLVTLVLWNNQLTHNGMGYLAAALPCTQSLETLNLGHNSVGNEGVHKLKDGLIANRSVLRLGLASTKLSCEGAVAVAEFIAESPRLLRLDLRENDIKTGGLMALSHALKVNTSLLRLDLDREPKKETVKSFIETQRALLAEIQNGCKRNFILAREREETEQKMRQSASMAEISSEETPRPEEEGEEASAAATTTSVSAVTSSPVAEGDQSGGGGGEEGAAESKPDGGDTGKESSSQVASSVIDDSDSDTEEEEEEEEKKNVPAGRGASLMNEGAPRPAKLPSAGASPSHRSPGPISSSISGSAPLTSTLSAITVTEAPVPPGTPPSPGRCISVSSPGRGHKIFMVTRVESPPEQPQLLAQLQSWREQDRAAQTQSQSQGPSPTNKDTTSKPKEAEHTHGPAQASSGGDVPRQGASGPAEEGQVDSLARKKDQSQLSEALTDPLGAQLLQPNPPALQHQQPPAQTDSSVTPPRQPNTASAVGVSEDLKESSQAVSAELSQPSADGQAEATKATEATAATAEATATAAAAEATAAKAAAVTPNPPEQQPQGSPDAHTQPQPAPVSADTLSRPEQVLETQSDSQTLVAEQASEPIAAEQQPGPQASETIPEPAAQEQESRESSQASEQDLPPQQQQQTVEECPLPSAMSEVSGNPETTVVLETPAEPDPCPGPEQLSSEQVLEAELEAELQLVLDQQTQPRPPPLSAECSDSSALLPSRNTSAAVSGATMATATQEQHVAPTGEEQASVTTSTVDMPQAEESSGDSPDESSTDDGESGTVEPSGAALPNGLKPEFALHLLDPEGPKPGSCVMEHVAAELHCGQDLEELLLEASLDTGREAP
ncbi:hypothetical protein AALO_G00201270 [Alosa alosa]|uniref:Protein phosphatase 1 regulatory subunit 37 n=2 Tax=Alosa alosa TaxID=278164 RepID=A0AAV6G5H1_9TELE|nr:hypothetical protein AALO_G00201270 [Alosa alosa]